jgi:DNA-binding HxlR family transcriptional regulator
MPVKDALDGLHGRWKMPIIIAVSFGSKRFNEIAREVPGITDKTLSKELKHLEVNQLLSRTAINLGST